MKALILGILVLSAASVSFADPVIDCPPDYRGGTMIVVVSPDGQTQIIQAPTTPAADQQVSGEVFAVDCKFY